MRLKLAFVSLCAVVLAASPALGGPPAGKGKPPATGEGCKPKVAVVLKGTLAGKAASSLTVTVTRSNRWGRAYATAGSASVGVDEGTKVRRLGKKTLADLVVGDRVHVQARACKADLASDATPALTALKVVAHPASS